MSSIGQQLKQVREARGLSMKQVVQATRIRVHYLEAMESDDFSSLPSAAQARGFLRSYADFLGLNADDLISQQRNATAPVAEFTSPNQEEPAAAPQPVSVAEPTAAPLASEDQPQPEPEPLQLEPEAEGNVAPPPKSPSVSQLIFVEIGKSLRQRRELISLTLDEIERHTHVRKYYLEIIESGNFDELPSPVQARGMLSNYATFLDMDTETTLLRFADALQAKRLERQASLPPTTITSSRRRIALPLWVRRFVSPDLLFGGGMILLLFILTVWGATRIFSKESTSGAQAPSISDVLLASPSAATLPATEALPTNVQVNPILDEITLTPTETLSADAANTGLQVTISVLERTFVRVTVDGVVKQDGRVVPGFAQTFDGVKSIEVLTGSGSGIQILFNQHNMGLMGNFGQVVDLVYTPNGAQTPTLIPSPTATVTSRYQKSPTTTRTPTISPTETATATPTVTPTAKQ